MKMKIKCYFIVLDLLFYLFYDTKFKLNSNGESVLD